MNCHKYGGFNGAKIITVKTLKGSPKPQWRSRRHLREFRLGESEGEGEGVLVFRSTRCRTVFQNVAEDFICEDCTGRRGRRKKEKKIEEKPKGPEEDLAADDAAEGIPIDVEEVADTEESFPRVCSYDGCGRSFRRLKPFNNHIKLHRMKETDQKEKKTRKKRKKMLKKKTSEGTYECEFCKTTYVYRKSFLKHVSSHQAEFSTSTSRLDPRNCWR